MQVSQNNINNSFCARWSTWLKPHFEKVANAAYKTQNQQEIALLKRNSNIIHDYFQNATIKCKTSNTAGMPVNTFYLEFPENKRLDIISIEKHSEPITIGVLCKIARKLEKLSKG